MKENVALPNDDDFFFLHQNSETIDFELASRTNKLNNMNFNNLVLNNFEYKMIMKPKNYKSSY